ncbi:MAG: VOC family protein, partial [Bryobacteraceae bacterium]
MRSVIPFGLILSAFAVSAASAQPVPIEGIAHVGFRTGDLEKARAYYTDVLGFQQAFELKTKDGGIASAFFKVNDEQYIEISPGLPPEEKIRLTHVAFETTDIEALRRILQSKGLNPPPVGRSGGGDLTFSLEDPDHQRIEFVQYKAGSMVSDARGKYVDSRRLSDHLQHVGVTVPKEKLAEAYHLYHDQLGFSEFWRLGPTPDDPQLIKLLVPGKRHDIVELMIYATSPSRAEYGSMQHINLEVPEITAPYFTLLDRGVSSSHLKPEVNAENIWGMNVFDPDGTRTEIQDIRKVPNLPIAVVG